MLLCLRVKTLACTRFCIFFAHVSIIEIVESCFVNVVYLELLVLCLYERREIKKNDAISKRLFNDAGNYCRLCSFADEFL